MKSFLYFPEKTTHFKQKLISYTAPPPKKNCHCLISNRKDKLLFKLFQDNPLKLLYQHFVIAVSCSSFLIVNFQGYFSMSPELHPGFSDQWRPPPALNSTSTTSCLSFLVLLLLYRKCYGFERAFFTLKRFLPYTRSTHLVHALPQPAFIKVSLETNSSPLKTTGLTTVVWNTDPTHMFVRITQCSKNT